MAQSKNNNKPLGWRLKAGERRLILIFGDLTSSLLSLWVAIYIWAQHDWLVTNWLNFIRERVQYWFYLLPILWLLLLIEIYDIRRASRVSETLKGIGTAAGALLVLYLFIFFLSDAESLPRSGVLIFIISSSLLTLLWRIIYIQIFTAPLFMRRVLIIGAGITGTTLIKICNEISPKPFHIIGLIDDNAQKIGTEIEGIPVLGNCSLLMEIVEKENISDLVFAISGEMSPEMLREMITAGESGIEITTMPILYEELLNRVPIASLQSDWILRYLVDQMHVGGIYEVGKRFIDILGGLVGLILMGVAFPFIAIAIMIDSGFPIFYSQDRVGKNAHNYRMYKFRTMFTDAEIDGKPKVTMQHDQRITRVGWLLRKTHIDELPQFFNVLIGDMSLVGPRAERPELMDELQCVIPFYRARLMVRPGLTGWAQVNYGYASNTKTNAVKTEFDLYYIKHRNLMLDFTILLRTPGTVIGFRGQ